MPKEISFGNDARQKIKAGINKATQAVAPTLGAIGMTAIVDWEGLDPEILDDGVRILKNLEFKDKYENMGLKMLRKAAVRTSEQGGDGTCTTSVLGNALVNEAYKEIAEDSSKIQSVKKRLEKGLELALSELSKIKREVKPEDIEKIATISSLDPEVSKLIAQVINEIGVHGVATVEKGSKIGYSSEIVKGARFDRGLLSQYFINDFDNERSVLEQPFILLVDRKVSINEQIIGLLNSIDKTGHKSLLIIADDVDGLALATLSQNSKSVRTMTPKGMVQGTWDIACVKNPYTGTRGKDFLQDIALLTGATVISEEAGMKLDDATLEQCGRAEKVITTKDNCTIIGGNASDQLQSRIEAIKGKIEATTSEYEKTMLEDRLACLTGGIGVIRVGAYTDADFNSKKIKFENAINSTQAALQEGILPGGGIALEHAAFQAEDDIFKIALGEPFLQMGRNAGILVRTSNVECERNWGYNFLTGEKVDMFDAGIIDPFKVVRLALESAVAIAINLITNETAIVNEVEDAK